MKTHISTNKSFLNTYKFENIDLIKDCIKNIQNKLIIHPSIIVFGRQCNQNRSIGFFSNNSIGYYYSNQCAKSQTLTPSLSKLLDTINTMFNSDFNGILVNYYENGTDYIGDHSDDEKGLSNIGVVSLSYGSVRKFRIKCKKTKKKIIDISTENSSIIHMGGDFQKEFTHGIPIEKKIKLPRWSFTFRKHLI